MHGRGRPAGGQRETTAGGGSTAARGTGRRGLAKRKEGVRCEGGRQGNARAPEVDSQPCAPWTWMPSTPLASSNAAASPNRRQTSSTSPSLSARGVRNASRWNSAAARLPGWASTRMAEGATGRASHGRQKGGHWRPGWLSWTMKSGGEAALSWPSAAAAVVRNESTRAAQGRVRSSVRTRAGGGGARSHGRRTSHGRAL